MEAAADRATWLIDCLTFLWVGGVKSEGGKKYLIIAANDVFIRTPAIPGRID